MSETIVVDSGPRAPRVLWWLPVVRGALLLILGVLMLLHPLETVAALTWVVGAFAVLDGILIIVQAFAERSRDGFWWQLLGGLVVVGLGVVVMVWPAPTVLVLFYVVTGWVLALGLVGLVAAITLHKRDDGTWFAALAFGLVNLVIGLLLAFNPQTSIAVVIVLFGVFALVAGVLLVVGGLSARSALKQLG